MTDQERTEAHARPDDSIERAITLRGVTAIMAAVVGLTFLFGFGNVWTLAPRLGVPPWVAPHAMDGPGCGYVRSHESSHEP